MNVGMVQHSTARNCGLTFRGSDDLSAYHNYTGGPIPKIEMDKFHLSVQAKSAADKGDFLSAAQTKRTLQGICTGQGKAEDAAKLSVGKHELLKRARAALGEGVPFRLPR